MDEVPNTFPWMFYGYAALWLVMVIFLASLLSRMRAVERALDQKQS